MTQIHLNGRLICTTLQQAATVARFLPAHIRLSQAEPGCRAFAVTPTADPLVWQVAETFTDRAAFDAHQVRTRGSRWFTATAAIARDFRVTEG